MDCQKISFSTQRLVIKPVIFTESVYNDLYQILTPNVTKYLPESFQNINSVSSVKELLEIMQSNSEVFSIVNKHDRSVIGLLILYVDNNIANIGYLFTEKVWHQGFASELLDGFINMAKKETSWKKLIGDVSLDNKASAILLEKKVLKTALMLNIQCLIII